MENPADPKLTHDEKARAHLAAIVDSSDDAIISKTPDGIVCSWNKGAEKLYGYTAQEAIGRQISFLVPAEHLPELQQVNRKIMQGERVEHLETVRLTKDGRRIHVSLTLSPILADDDRIIGISTIARDITELKRMEKLLRESERRYRTLVEMAPDAVVVHQDGRFVYANCAALGIYGAEAIEQLQRTTLIDLVHPGDRGSVLERIRQLLDGEEIPLREYRLLRLDGVEVPVEASGTLIDYQGKPSIQVIARDITERKRAEREREGMLKELAFERSRFETVVRQLPLGVMIAEAPSGRLLYDNEQSRRIFRRQTETTAGVADYSRWKLFRMDGSVLPVEEFPLVRAVRGETVCEEELRIERDDGTVGFVCVNAIPLRDACGQIISGLAAFSDITESKAAAQALSDSDQRLKLALDAAEMGSCDVDLRTGKGTWSRRHFLLLGYEPPEGDSGLAANDMWQRLVHPDDLERVTEGLRRAKREGGVFRSEHRILRADNRQTIWVNVQGRFICDPSGEACRFIGVIFEVTERKAAEEALRRSEQRFRQMADSIPQIAWTAEADGSIDYLNAHFEAYTGIDRRVLEMRAKKILPQQLISEIVHPEDAEQTATAWQNSVLSGDIFQSESRLRRVDGVYRWHLCRAIPERDENGRLIKWHGTATDIDDLREVQEKLRASESTLKLAIETSDIGIFDLHLRTGKLVWSDIAKRHYGLPPEAEADLTVLLSGVHPDDREYIERIARDALRPGGPGLYRAEYRTVGLQDGKLRWLSMRGRVAADADGKPARLIGACLDISEIVRAENSLKEEIAERLRAVEELARQEQLLIRQGRLAAMGEMIGNIAHQWRQPLNTLALIVQELPRYYERNLFSTEYLNASVTRAMQVINYMSKTIDGFRNFFGQDQQKEHFKAGEVLAKTVSIVEAAFNELMLKIEVNADDDMVILGSPNEFSQVILNILMNAKDALLERKVAGPKVVIKLFKEDGKTVLTIADNAGGIDQEIIDKIFDPYFTTKVPDKGTGIGLFMSKTIIEKNMNGCLSVHNTEDGAEFRIEV
jgi:PAS domain S-box-containing protein